ncbi:hypothetical protein HMPREF0972_00093 [Actinomyces sp. oral taxon 848 str. F0332]|nr:hypothetical protein HMPREF0972_00093 [Actinomyces sp. oral taxon 848 str. F0332]
MFSFPTFRLVRSPIFWAPSLAANRRLVDRNIFDSSITFGCDHFTDGRPQGSDFEK